MGWIVGAVAVAAFGVVVRLALGGTAVGERSSSLMALLLTLAAWSAAIVLSNARMALLVVAGCTLVFDMGALPPRAAPPYDDLLAFYGTDQMLTQQVPVAAGGNAVVLLAKAEFGGAQPAFGLAGDVNGSSANWTCPFQRDAIGPVVLPLPPAVALGGSTATVKLHLTGAPNHETDYLVVYASSQQGGFLISVQPAASINQSATVCSFG